MQKEMCTKLPPMERGGVHLTLHTCASYLGLVVLSPPPLLSILFFFFFFSWQTLSCCLQVSSPPCQGFFWPHHMLGQSSRKARCTQYYILAPIPRVALEPDVVGYKLWSQVDLVEGEGDSDALSTPVALECWVSPDNRDCLDCSLFRLVSLSPTGLSSNTSKLTTHDYSHVLGPVSVETQTKTLA